MNETNNTTPMQIDIERLQPAQWNTHRKSDTDDDAMRGLAESIKRNGMLHRVAVRAVAGATQDTYEIIDGHRRYEAARMLGWDTIPCEVHATLTDDAAQTMTATANIQRTENDPLLEAELIERMRNDGLTYREIAARIGKDEYYVGRRARICNLSDKWRALFANSNGDAATMEMIAAYERELQDEVYDALRINVENFELETDDIMRNFRQRILKLDGEIPFDTTHCKECQNNTATHGYLFPAEEDEDCQGRCENGECFRKKWNEAIDKRIEQLREKNETIIAVKQRWDVPCLWSATDRKTHDNKKAYVYEQDGVKYIIWSHAASAPGKEKKAMTAAEKEEAARIKKAHADWSKARRGVYDRFRTAIAHAENSEEKAKKLAETITGKNGWIAKQRDKIAKSFTDTWAYDDAIQEYLLEMTNDEVISLGCWITEDERKAIEREDPAKEQNTEVTK